MAYLDTRDAFAAATPLFAHHAHAAFERDEWKVIVLAQKDGLDSLRAPGRLTRFFAWAFGGQADRRLANGRLEALRRLAVHAWHQGYQVPVSAIKAFKDAGFSVDQLEGLLATIANSRQAHARR